MAEALGKEAAAGPRRNESAVDVKEHDAAHCHFSSMTAAEVPAGGPVTSHRNSLAGRLVRKPDPDRGSGPVHDRAL